MQSEVILAYRGPDVENHSISLDDLLPSIQGFYSSLKTINNYYGYSQQIELRLEKVEEGSVKLKLKALWHDATPDARLTNITNLSVPVIATIVGALVNVVFLKKHLQGSPVSNVEYSGDNLTVYNINNSPITVSQDTYELSQDEKLTKNLNRYVKTLSENKIKETSFELIDEENVVTEATISSEEKIAFTEISTEISLTKNVSLRGRFITLNKQRNTGSFQPEGSNSVRYKFISDSPESMYYDFAYNGVVEVTGLAKYDSEEKMVSIEIYSVEKLQEELFEISNQE